MSHAEEVSEMASPVSETVVETHITTNGMWENAPEPEDGLTTVRGVNRRSKPKPT